MKKLLAKTRVLLTLVITLLILGAVAVGAFAVDRTASYDNKYGQIVPTDSKLEARKTSFTFYGDKATLYFMRISKGEKNANYAVEIYADKACTELIRSMAGEFDSKKGNTPLAIAWSFKSVPSGTYYGKCYTYVSRDDGDVVDEDSVQTFKIKIDRISKKTVSLKSIKNTSSGIKITWGTVSTATKYKVMRKAPGESKWKTIATLGKGSYTYTDSSVKSGKAYKYTVRCYDDKYSSLYNKTGLSITYLSQPKLVDIQGTGSKGYAEITWKKVTGATSYEIYRKGGTLSNDEWKKIATVKGNKTVEYVDKTAKKTDWAYSYSVRAVKGSNKSTYNSDGLEFNYIKAPVLKKATSYTNGVRITWNEANDEVVKYYVYRKTSSGWKKIGTTTKKEYTDTTAKSGKKYTYTVKAVSKNNVGAYNSKGISVSYLSMPALGTVTFDANKYAKVTWSTVSGAKSYTVYRKINDADEWTAIATVKGSTKKSYTDKTSKKSGYTYKYTVKAVNGDATSYYNKTGIEKMYLSQPSASLSNTTSADGSLRVKVSWKSITGAKSYNVYRQSPSDKSLVLIASNVTGTTYYDATAKNNVKYKYTVRAVNGKSISRYASVSIIALARPVMQSVTLTSKGVELSWNKVAGADTYYVYRKPVGGKWELIGSYALNAYVDVSKEALTTPYYYTVAAEADGYMSDCDTVGMKNFVEVADFTAEFVAATEESLPVININWTYAAGVNSVELFKAIGDDVVSVGVFTAEEGITQYLDYDIIVGTEYTYTIKAVEEGKLSTQKSAKAKYPHAPLEAVKYEVIPEYNLDGSFIGVVFTPVDFAENYQILKKASGSDKWSVVTTVAADQVTEEYFYYMDYNVDEEITYTYTVKAVASDRDSLYDEAGIVATVRIPVQPAAGIIAKEDVITVTTEDGAEIEKVVAVITWDAVENGQYYKILRKAVGADWNIEEDFIGIVYAGDELKYIDETIEEGVQYIYTIAVSAPLRGEAINEIGADFCWGTPVVPEEPTEPDVPTTPENPDDSEDIIVPEEPGTPTVPDIPEIEDVPDEPVVPEEIPDGPTANPDEAVDPDIPQVL